MPVIPAPPGPANIGSVGIEIRCGNVKMVIGHAENYWWRDFFPYTQPALAFSPCVLVPPASEGNGFTMLMERARPV